MCLIGACPTDVANLLVSHNPTIDVSKQSYDGRSPDFEALKFVSGVQHVDFLPDRTFSKFPTNSSTVLEPRNPSIDNFFFVIQKHGSPDLKALRL